MHYKGAVLNSFLFNREKAVTVITWIDNPLPLSCRLLIFHITSHSFNEISLAIDKPRRQHLLMRREGHPEVGQNH